MRLIILLGLVVAGCATTPSPELAYWKCLNVKHSYVACQDKEVIR